MSSNPDRPPVENARARRAYEEYRAMGPGRSAARLAEMYRDLRNAGEWVPSASLATLNRWKGLFDWDARVIADDRATALEQNQRNLETWEKARIDWRKRMLGTGERMMARAEEMLQWPIAERTIDRDGQTVILKPGRWNFGTVAQMAEAADRMVRLAAEMETQRVAVTADVARVAKSLGVDESLLAELAEAIENGRDDISKIIEKSLGQ